MAAGCQSPGAHTSPVRFADPLARGDGSGSDRQTINAVLELSAAPALEEGEISTSLLGRGLEGELAALFDARDLWAFASLGNLDDIEVRLGAGVQVLVGIQSHPLRLDGRRLVRVVGVDRKAGTVCWVGGAGEQTSESEEAFLNHWRPVGFWMLTVCRPDRATWTLDVKERVVRARLYERTGRLDEAARDFEAALAQRRADAGLWAELGTVHCLAGRAAEAERTYTKALADCPNDARLLAGLARQLGEAGRELDRAAQLARRAVALEPANPSMLDVLGLVLLQQGRFEESRGILQRARMLATALPAGARGQLALRLARAHVGCGEAELARALVNQTLAEQPGLAIPQELRLLLFPATASL